MPVTACSNCREFVQAVLLVYFSSIVMQVIRTEAILNNVKLCFLILSCIAEDQYANSLMHDANLAFRVQLHRVPMHHRKLQDKIAPTQPLAATLLGTSLL